MIELQKECLTVPLKQARAAIGTAKTLPVLDMAKVRIDGSEVRVIGTDLETQITATAEAVGSEDLGDEAMEFLAPAKKLADLLGGMADGARIRLSCGEERLTVAYGRARYVLPILPVEQYPDREPIKLKASVFLPSCDLANAIQTAYESAAQKDVRYYLCGVLLQVDKNNWWAVGSDGHRMGWYESQFEGDPASASAILPYKSTSALLRHLPRNDEPLPVEFGEGAVAVQLPGMRFEAKTIEGKFPDWRSVVLGQWDLASCAVRADDLRAALKRMAALREVDFKACLVGSDRDTLTLHSTQPSTAEADEAVVVQELSGEFKVAINETYIVSALDALGADTVRLHQVGANNGEALMVAPALGGPARVLIMSVRT